MMTAMAIASAGVITRVYKSVRAGLVMGEAHLLANVESDRRRLTRSIYVLGDV